MIRSSRRCFAPASVAVLSFFVAGCSTTMLESSKVDYKSARQAPSLEIPPDLTAPSRDNRYAVPDVAPRGVATYSAYQADRVAQPAVSSGSPQVLASVENMRIERAGSQRWLVVQGAPEVLWPQVKDFWVELGFVLNIERPEIGVMETDWAEDRAKIPQDFLRRSIGRLLEGLYSTPERDRFRTRLEAGRTPGTVEIYISHRGMQEIYPNEAKDRTIWQPRPADPELEAEMLSRLMIRLGAEEAQARAMVAEAPGKPRTSLMSEGGEAALTLEDAFDRAWRRVGLALDRSGFTVEDRDRSKGLYFVRYVDPDKDAGKEEGFLSRLAFWRSKDEPSLEGSRYRVRVDESGSRSRVTVLSPEGGEDQSVTARRILGLLEAQLR